MKAFHCDHCRSLVYFENIQCLKCGHALGFLPDVNDLSTLVLTPDGAWQAIAPEAKDATYRQCLNGTQHRVCNWMVRGEDPDPFCTACRLNDVIPDLNVWGNLDRWRKLEAAKRRIIYTITRLGLSTQGVPAENRPPMRFRFLGTPDLGQRPLTGHVWGAITVHIAEADDDERERQRVHLREPFRTLIGHLRHEIAHYYWEQLISHTPRLTRFRELFGNEETNYDAALQLHYQQGPSPGWQDRHISAYASAHPWEDWAETWAHYLHIADTVETAASFGIMLSPLHPDAPAMTANPIEVASPDAPFDEVIAHWLPLTRALNSVNRGMGLPDLYPFVLSGPAIEKLRFVHEVVREARSTAPG